jgi:hypothetical protein
LILQRSDNSSFNGFRGWIFQSSLVNSFFPFEEQRAEEIRRG